MQPWSSSGVLFCLLAFALPAHADIYYYDDSNGVRHFTDECDDPRCTLFMRTAKSVKTANYPSSRHLTKITLYGSNYIRRGSKHHGKPFRVNEANRQRFTPHIERIARKYGLDPNLMHAVISAESAFNPIAVSHAGAMGLMQLMPATAQRFGVNDPYDPVANMQGGARYLKWLLDKFNSTHLALAAYNAGEGAVIRYGNTIPPYKETRTYVDRVLRFYSHYKGVN